MARTLTKIGVGVIGCGGISGLHLSNLAKRDDVEIISVADVVEERARETAEEFAAKSFVTDYNELLRRSEIQAVLVLVPQGFHSEVVIAAARAGKHVFCEKPMAMTLAQCQAMRQAIEMAGTLFQIGYSMRFSPDTINLRNQIVSGVIGRPVLFRDIWAITRGSAAAWVHNAELGGGPLFENSHWIDLLNSLFGRPRKVYASLRNYKLETTAADTILVVIDYEEGDQALWSDCWAAPGFGWGYLRARKLRPHLDIIGPKGSLHFPDADGSQVLSLYLNDSVDNPVQTWHWEQDWGVNMSAYEAELDHFLNCIRQEQPPLPGIEEGQLAVEVAEAARQSSETGMPVELPLPALKPI